MFFITDEKDVILKDKIQSLYFYASWMPYHKKMMIMIDKVEKKYNVEFLAIDVDCFKNLCNRFTVKSIPEIIIFSQGKEVKRLNGLILTSAFKSAFVDICKS